MSLDRAYSLLQVKSLDEERRVVYGMATTPSTDRGGDIVEPFGVKFKNPLPFILHHKHDLPVGEVFFKTPTADGIPFEAHIPKVVEPGIVQDRTNEAWHSAKYKLLKGVSIGYLPLDATPIRTGGHHLKSIEVIELSMVSVPMNRETTITAIKALDDSILARLGTRTSVPSHNLPVASGLRKGVAMLTISERVVAAQADLKTKSARFSELSVQSEAEGGLTAEDSTEMSTLGVAIKSLTGQIENLKIQESAEAALATPIGRPATKAASTTTTVQVQTKALPKGGLFVRYALAVAAGKGSFSDTLAYAKRFTDTPEVAAYVKSMFERKALEGSTTDGSPGWGGELVNPDTAQTEFVELLMPETIIGKVTGFRKVPFNIPIITQTGGSTFEWVGEGGVKPVGELSFDRTTLGNSKCAGIIVMTEELVRLSRPNSEALARQDMIEQCAKFLDQQFVDPAVSAGADNPASITNGVASPAASGTDADALKVDLRTALATFTSNNIPTSGLAIVTTPAVALGISLLENALGQKPNGIDMTPQGGTILGYPVIVSESAPSATLVIFKPSEIFLADDGQVRLDASNQATLDMSGGSSPTFNLWQRNCVGIRAERWIRWQKRRANVVAVIDTINYGPS